jgi:hypothetical protein
MLEVTMRRVTVIALCAVSFLIALPAPAHAWWDWLDELSGPGPFTGFDFKWRIACINDPAPREVARKREEQKRLADAMAAALASSAEKRTFVAPPEVTDEEAETLAATIRQSVNPGDHVLRSLTSFKDSHQNWAAFLGAGCLSQHNANPIGSLNLRLAYLWSIDNRLTYAEPEFAEDGPQVKLFQPELSFTVFVDRRKSVELGSGMGVSFAFIDKENVGVLKRFYWRPFILTVSPVSLLRLKTAKGWRALTLTSSIVIMPQELNDVDFGAVPGTFHTSGEMQGSFGITLDLSRF